MSYDFKNELTLLLNNLLIGKCTLYITDITLLNNNTLVFSILVNVKLAKRQPHTTLFKHLKLIKPLLQHMLRKRIVLKIIITPFNTLVDSLFCHTLRSPSQRIYLKQLNTTHSNNNIQLKKYYSLHDYYLTDSNHSSRQSLLNKIPLSLPRIPIFKLNLSKLTTWIDNFFRLSKLRNLGKTYNTLTINELAKYAILLGYRGKNFLVDYLFTYIHTYRQKDNNHKGLSLQIKGKIRHSLKKSKKTLTKGKIRKAIISHKLIKTIPKIGKVGIKLWIN